MTLKEFIRATAGLPADTNILVTDPWGGLEQACLIRREDLQEGDPVLDELTAGNICICADADVDLNFVLNEDAKKRISAAQ